MENCNDCGAIKERIKNNATEIQEVKDTQTRRWEKQESWNEKTLERINSINMKVVAVYAVVTFAASFIGALVKDFFVK